MVIVMPIRVLNYANLSAAAVARIEHELSDEHALKDLIALSAVEGARWETTVR
jgi:hypothetical protein